MRKIILIITITLFTIYFVSSCKKDIGQNKHLKIGMFVVGNGYNDSGYKQSCKNGLLSAMEKNSFDTLFVSSMTHSQDELDYFPQNGFDALFLAGSLASNELLVSASNFPDKQFVIVDYKYDGTLSNVQSICYNINEAAFPLGFLAAFWANNTDNVKPVVGIVGGMDIEPVQRFTKAYSLGVSYFNSKYNKNVSVALHFLNSFDDTDKGYQVADSLIKQCSVDIIMVAAGAAANGSFEAVKANNICAVGTDVDQFYSLPDLSGIFLSSCMKSLDSTICSVATNYIQNPVPSSSAYIGTLKNHGVKIAPFHKFDSQIPDSIKSAIKIIEEGIINSSVNTGF
jgi:basic membrane protein A and related proteins